MDEARRLVRAAKRRLQRKAPGVRGASSATDSESSLAQQVRVQATEDLPKRVVSAVAPPVLAMVADMAA